MAMYKLLISANSHGMSHEQLESHPKLAFDSYRTYQSLVNAAKEIPAVSAFCTFYYDRCRYEFATFKTMSKLNEV